MIIYVADVDECITGIATCSVGEHCVNTEGSYRCSPICPPGFRLRNNSRSTSKAEEFCEDINECSLGLHTCNSLTHYCRNTNGSYICGLRTTTTTTSTIETSISTTTRRFIGSRYNRVPVLRISQLINYIDLARTICICIVLARLSLQCNILYLYSRTWIVTGLPNPADWDTRETLVRAIAWT